MRCCLPAVCLAFALAPAPAGAQGGMSQTRLEDDCLQRLRPLVPREVKPVGVNFSALGNYAAYYVVSWRFPAALENGARNATCTYRRDGQWVRDDAAAHKLARELASSPRRAKVD
jgi:hypothetical protein